MKVNYDMDIMDINDSNKRYFSKLILAIANYDIFKNREDFYHKYIKPNGTIDSFIIDTLEVVEAFMLNKDHGFEHSVNVYKRCEKILFDISKNGESLPFDTREALNVFKWAAIFHDFSRFYGASNSNHEQISMEIAKNALYKMSKDYTGSFILLCIEKHDWLNFEVSGELDNKFKRNPIFDIFRLADKTSISPVEELNRYYETGKRCKTTFFNPEMDIKKRFDFKNNHEERDAITHFLLIFELNENNFFFNATNRFYKEWAGNKKEVKEHIVKKLCIQENIPDNQIGMIKNILQKFN